MTLWITFLGLLHWSATRFNRRFSAAFVAAFAFASGHDLRRSHSRHAAVDADFRDLFRAAIVGISLPQTVAAVAALSLNAAAYIAEIFRGGIESIESGQMEAARALGMNYQSAMRWVILPQTVRRVLPPLTNEAVALLERFVADFHHRTFRIDARRTRTGQQFRFASHNRFGRRAALFSDDFAADAFGAQLGSALAANQRATWERQENNLMKNDLSPVLSIAGLHKSFGRLEVLKGIDLSVREGEVIALDWRVRQRQIHAAALHQSPRNAHAGHDSISRHRFIAHQSATRP